MQLSSDLISQLVKATKPENTSSVNDSMAYGTVVIDGRLYVKIDGSDLLTPVSTTTNVQQDDRVVVTVQNHNAIVTGNLSSPAARSGDVDEMGDQLRGQMAELDTVISKKISTDEFIAEVARINSLVADNVSIKEKLTATEADIDTLQADSLTVNEKLTANEASIKNLETEKLDTTFADITYAHVDSLEALEITVHNLEGTYASFEQLTSTNFETVNAAISTLEANKIDAEVADIKYVNVDFANIDKAWMEEFYARSGLVEYITAEDATVTGHLVGVTITGDLIEGGTVKADKLVVRGTDGIYYKLNFEAGNFTDAEEIPVDSLHGSIITAKSITAEKVSVSDLVAFGATIGGFNISREALYSGIKSDIYSPMQGIYMDTYGQFNVGDGNNFLRYAREPVATATIINNSLVVNADEDVDYISTDISDDIFHVISVIDGKVNADIIDGVFTVDSNIYKLRISADSIVFGDDSKSTAEDLRTLTEHVKISTIVDETGDVKPCVELSEGDSDFRQVITNEKTIFMDGSNPRTEIDPEGVKTENVTVKEEFRHFDFVWSGRANGNYGLSWKGGAS